MTGHKEYTFNPPLGFGCQALLKGLEELNSRVVALTMKIVTELDTYNLQVTNYLMKVC